VWYKNIAGRFFGLVTKHACDRQTDRQTDRRKDGRTHGHNYDSQDRASIAASRGKNGDVQKKRSRREVRGVSPEAGRESMVGKICERGKS